jgi:hypothetical protein
VTVTSPVDLLAALSGQRDDDVVELRPVEARLIERPERFQKILATRTFPSLARRVRFHSFDSGDGKMLSAIEVQELERDERPALLKTTAEREGVQVEVWAICRRVSSQTERLPAAQVWADVRDGRRARDNLHLATPDSYGRAIRDRIEESAVSCSSSCARRRCWRCFGATPVASCGVPAGVISVSCRRSPGV